MFLPIRDDNPTSRPPLLTITVMVACVAVFLWQESQSGREALWTLHAYGAVPAVVLGGAEPAAVGAPLPGVLTLISSMFLHGGWLHLGGNMLYLWIFGNNIEDRFGAVRFLAFYLLAGVAAALAQAISEPHSTIPMVGASGAISGVLAAYLLSYPRARITILVWILIFIRTFKVPAWVVIGIWFGLQLFNFLSEAGGGGGGVAWMAHIGGFVAGLALVPLLRPRLPPSAPSGYAALRGKRPWDDPGPRRGPWG